MNVTNITLNSNYEIFNAAGQLVSKGNLGTGKVAVNKLKKKESIKLINNILNNMKNNVMEMSDKMLVRIRSIMKKVND